MQSLFLHYYLFIILLLLLLLTYFCLALYIQAVLHIHALRSTAWKKIIANIYYYFHVNLHDNLRKVSFVKGGDNKADF